MGLSGEIWLGLFSVGIELRIESGSMVAEAVMADQRSARCLPSVTIQELPTHLLGTTKHAKHLLKKISKMSMPVFSRHFCTCFCRPRSCSGVFYCSPSGSYRQTSTFKLRTSNFKLQRGSRKAAPAVAATGRRPPRRSPAEPRRPRRR